MMQLCSQDHWVGFGVTLGGLSPPPHLCLTSYTGRQTDREIGRHTDRQADKENGSENVTLVTVTHHDKPLSCSYNHNSDRRNTKKRKLVTGICINRS